MNILNGRFGEAVRRVKRADDRFDSLTVLSFRARGEEACIHSMQGFPVNVPLPAPDRTRNALRVEDEWTVMLDAGQQAHHAISANSFQRPGGRLPVLLQGFGAHLLIDHLDRIVACGEAFSRALLPRPAVFFSVPA